MIAYFWISYEIKNPVTELPQVDPNLYEMWKACTKFARLLKTRVSCKLYLQEDLQKQTFQRLLYNLILENYSGESDDSQVLKLMDFQFLFHGQCQRSSLYPAKFHYIIKLDPLGLWLVYKLKPDNMPNIFNHLNIGSHPWESWELEQIRFSPSYIKTTRILDTLNSDSNTRALTLRYYYYWISTSGTCLCDHSVRNLILVPVPKGPFTRGLYPIGSSINWTRVSPAPIKWPPYTWRERVTDFYDIYFSSQFA